MFSYIVVPLALEGNGMLQYAFNVFHNSISMIHSGSSDYPINFENLFYYDQLDVLEFLKLDAAWCTSSIGMFNMHWQMLWILKDIPCWHRYLWGHSLGCQLNMMKCVGHLVLAIRYEVASRFSCSFMSTSINNHILYKIASCPLYQLWIKIEVVQHSTIDICPCSCYSHTRIFHKKLIILYS